ncbi:MAG: hypothetical protein KAS12_04670 [Candidatus Aenigmarchaeota archaeon]|nr:hypothetical protein [Candidatus Aenigmarchaeota archaeon]
MSQKEILVCIYGPFQATNDIYKAIQEVLVKDDIEMNIATANIICVQGTAPIALKSKFYKISIDGNDWIVDIVNNLRVQVTCSV